MSDCGQYILFNYTKPWSSAGCRKTSSAIEWYRLINANVMISIIAEETVAETCPWIVWSMQSHRIVHSSTAMNMITLLNPWILWERKMFYSSLYSSVEWQMSHFQQKSWWLHGRSPQWGTLSSNGKKLTETSSAFWSAACRRITQNFKTVDAIIFSKSLNTYHHEILHSSIYVSALWQPSYSQQKMLMIAWSLSSAGHGIQ